VGGFVRFKILAVSSKTIVFILLAVLRSDASHVLVRTGLRAYTGAIVFVAIRPAGPELHLKQSDRRRHQLFGALADLTVEVRVIMRVKAPFKDHRAAGTIMEAGGDA
jgi:hypothetical protein